MFKNLALMAAAIVVGLLLGEAVARIAVDADDFLNPYLTTHPQFKTMILPNSAGHDRWGFRNASVPRQADVVTIGDSFAYGYLAPKDNNWPSIVGRQTGLKVYNVSMGAWGPSQYACAMKVYAAALKPNPATAADVSRRSAPQSTRNAATRPIAKRIAPVAAVRIWKIRRP